MKRTVEMRRICMLVSLSLGLLTAAAALGDVNRFEKAGVSSFVVKTVTTPLITSLVTDAKGNEITDAIGWPRTQLPDKRTPPEPGSRESTWTTNVYIPAKVQKKGTGVGTIPPEQIDVGDYAHVINTDPAARTTSMYFESIQHDAVAGYYIANVFGQIAQERGLRSKVVVPFFDSFDAADFYGLVDLNVYLFHPEPAFGIFDAVAITNGQSSAFPGMLFSTTPFVLDPVNGYQYAAFNGDAQVIGFTELQAVPEPTLAAILGALAGGVLFLRRRAMRSPREGAAWQRVRGRSIIGS